MRILLLSPCIAMLVLSCNPEPTADSTNTARPEETSEQTSALCSPSDVDGNCSGGFHSATSCKYEQVRVRYHVLTPSTITIDSVDWRGGTASDCCDPTNDQASWQLLSAKITPTSNPSSTLWSIGAQGVQTTCDSETSTFSKSVGLNVNVATTVSYQLETVSQGGLHTPASDTATTPAPSVGCGGLGAGQGLFTGDAITSCDSRFRLEMQSSGNLVLSQVGVGTLWSRPNNGQVGVRAFMQTDGNLVVYNSSGTAIFASNTNGHPGATLAVQTDGNLVIYTGSTPIWATGTNTAECGCYAGTGAYCGWAAINHASQSRCRLPTSLTSGFLYHCASDSWTIQERCPSQQCSFNPNGADFCTQDCGGPICGGTCCASGDWCGNSGQCCSGCSPGCPC
jgi:hypothetical protein